MSCKFHYTQLFSFLTLHVKNTLSIEYHYFCAGLFIWFLKLRHLYLYKKLRLRLCDYLSMWLWCLLPGSHSFSVRNGRWRCCHKQRGVPLELLCAPLAPPQKKSQAAEKNRCSTLSIRAARSRFLTWAKPAGAASLKCL